MRQKLVGLAAKGGSVKAELKPLQAELRKIDSLSTGRFRFKVWSAYALFLPLSQLATPLHLSQHVGNMIAESLALAGVGSRHEPVPHFWKNVLISFRRFVPRKNQSMLPHRSNPFMTSSPGSVRSLRALRFHTVGRYERSTSGVIR